MVSFSEDSTLSITINDLTEIEGFRSKLHDVVFYSHPIFGHVLTIDGELHHLEKCADLYHEPLVHLPSSYIPELKTGLILGGGSLFAAWEMLRYRSLDRLVLVDHDKSILDLMSRHYDHAKKVLNDPRFHHFEIDAFEYLESNTEQFDLVVNDCFNLAELSVQREVNAYELLRKRAVRHGMCSDTSYRNIFEENLDLIAELISATGSAATAGLITIPEYPGALHVHTIWGGADQNTQDIANYELRDSLALCNELKYFDPAHREFFCYLPPRLRSKFRIT